MRTAQKLTVFLGALLSAFVGLRVSASSVTKCEFLLHRKSDIALARDTLHVALTDFKNLETYYVTPVLESPALAWIGLDKISRSDRHRVALRIYGPSQEDPRELHVQREEGDRFETLKRFKLPRQLLPLFAWQKLPFSPMRFDALIEDNLLGGTTYKLAPMQVEHLEVGLVLEEFPEGRLVFGTQSNFANHAYHLWADVDCERMAEFTPSQSVQVVRTENGWLCRVPLLLSAAGVGPRNFYFP